MPASIPPEPGPRHRQPNPPDPDAAPPTAPRRRPDGPVRHRMVERMDRYGRTLVGVSIGAVLLVVLTLIASALGMIGPSSGGGAGRAAAGVTPYRDPALPVPERVADLLTRMSPAEKVGQLVQVDHGALASPADVGAYRIGSVRADGNWAPADNTAAGWAQAYDDVQRQATGTPLGIPLIYGVDAAHGHNVVRDATIFPHNIGLGASRDAGLAQRIGRATAEEIAATGIDWAFAPCLCLTGQAGGRGGYESFGERLEIAASMASMVAGLQGPVVNEPTSVLATAKHQVGPGDLTEDRLRAVHVPPLHAAVSNGAGAVLLSFADWSGGRATAHQRLVTDLLKGELGFTGFVLTDSAGLAAIDGTTGLSGAEIAAAVNGGIDMLAVTAGHQEFTALLQAEVDAGRISPQRLDDANTRILTRKFELGLFERPLADPALLGSVGSQPHRDLAREAVRASQVLLKNDDEVLPLAKAGGKIFVAGRNADDIGNQAGGMTLTRQGASGGVTTGTTILAGVREAVGTGTTVTYQRDGKGVNRSYRAAIAVVGELPYADGGADLPALDRADTRMLDRLRAAGVPVVVVVVSGRPVQVADRIDDWAALVAAWLPGTEGRGVADVLFGDHNPAARLPVTWPAAPASGGSGGGKAGAARAELFPYGFGLSFPAAAGPTPSARPPAPPAAPAPGARPTTTRPPAVAPTPSSRPTPSSTPTTPAAPAAPSASASASPSAGALACAVGYTVGSRWSDGFVAEVRVTSRAAVNGWTLRFTLPAGQRISQAWNATVSQNGTTVTATNASWNAAIAAGGEVSFGFLAGHDGTSGGPTGSSLNGTPCG
nr:glycoside hydrolase family 3 N-terminal domain-containing protein [Micromonospora sp. DSM 115978]